MANETPQDVALSDADIISIFAEHSGTYSSDDCVCEWVDAPAFARAVIAAAMGWPTVPPKEPT